MSTGVAGAMLVAPLEVSALQIVPREGGPVEQNGFLAPAVQQNTGLGDAMSAPGLRTDEGTEQTLFAGTERATVLVFVGRECPISNRYTPTLNRLRRETLATHGQSSVAFWLVYPERGVTAVEVREHREAWDHEWPALLDLDRTAVELVGAAVTPEAALFDDRGTLIYRGRIDDRFRALTRSRPRATRHELKSALDALLAGEPVPVAHAPAVGCFIE